MCSKNVNKEKNNNNSEIFKALNLDDLNLKANREISSSIGFSNWVRALLQNWRQGTVGCKDRSEVAFSNKKPWKQKGTGRARAGTRRSPLWRGGGVIFGPQLRVKKLKVNKEQKRQVLGDVFYNLLNSKNVFSLDWQPSEKPNTNDAYKLLKNLNLLETKINLLVDSNDFATQASFANIPNINIVLFDEINAFYLASGKKIMFLNKDFDKFKNMVERCI